MNSNAKIKVLFLITDLGRGGAERFLIDLCSELENYPDVEFVIGSLFDNNEYSDLTKNFKVENLNFQTFSLRGKNENLSYKKLIEEFQPNIIHTHRFLAEFLSSYYVSDSIAYVCHGHDNMVQLKSTGIDSFFSKEKLLNTIEKQWIIRKKYKKAKTYIVTNSNDTRLYFISNLPRFMQKQVVYIPMGFNYDRFYQDSKRINNTLKKIKILNIGSYQDKKNQRFLIDIAIELRSRGIDFEINMIGQGQNFTLIKELIIQNNLQNFVFQRGLINKVEDWYKEADVYVHTAYYEPFGLVFLEAMASGTPIITLDGKGNRDLIENGVNGFMIEQQDSKLFVNQIEYLIKDEELYQTIVKNARVFANQFDSKEKTKELVDFYYQILS